MLFLEYAHKMVLRHLVAVSPCLLVVLLLTACGPSAATPVPESIGGAVSPEVVAENFFEDFGKALKDPLIKDDDQRQRWASTLADYFAPNERDDHREALQAMLDNFASELTSEVAPGEEFILEVRYDDFQQIAQQDQRALVQVVNGRVYWQVLRDGYLVDEQETPLTQIIGRPDDAIPVVRVGTNWFLTERY